MSDPKLPASRSNLYTRLGAQLYPATCHASASGYYVGELHTERTVLTREQIASRCRSQRIAAGLPDLDAPAVRSRDAGPPGHASLLQHAAATAGAIRSAGAAMIDALIPGFPGAAGSQLEGKGDGTEPTPMLSAGPGLADPSIDDFVEFVETLGLNASFSRLFSPFNATGSSRNNGVTVTPSFDPSELSLDDLVIFLEQDQPGGTEQAGRLDEMLRYLVRYGDRVVSASADVLGKLGCGKLVQCVPVQSICDARALLKTVLEHAPGTSRNIVVLEADAIETLASMISPSFTNATRDFVWATSSLARAFGPRHQAICGAPVPTGPAQPCHPSQGNDNIVLAVSLAGIGAMAIAASVAVFGVSYYRHPRAANPHAAPAATQVVPMQVADASAQEAEAPSRISDTGDDDSND